MNLYFRISLWIFIFCPLLAWTQVHVRLVAAQLPASHGPDTVYAAGSFNRWKPHDNKYKFTVIGNGARALDLDLPAGKYEFKITRGDWSRVETTAEGKNPGNRLLVVTKDTTIKLVIAGWGDDFKKDAYVRKHTASPNVTIMDTAFAMPQLNRNRRITLYLPKDYYTNTKKKFGVLYMHDGQNLFDEATSGFGEWGIDECLDSLFAQGVKECIVVGIDNGPKRMTEYNPYNFTSFGNGEGNGYVDFIVSTLKPFIDSHLRTLKGKRNTFIAGSSMGGLISMYAVLKYPGTFGGAGIFSPAFWVAPALEEEIKTAASKVNSRLFFYAGGNESKNMVPDMKKIEEGIKSASHSKVFEAIDPQAKHNEAAWRKYFPVFYKYLIGN